MRDSPARRDIAIVGAGPAGLMAAALLGRDFSVLVADPRPVGSAKPCAGLLSQEAHAALERLGAPEGVYDEPAELGLRAVILGRELPARRFFNIERGALQSWMAQKARAAGAQVARAGLRSLESADRGWRLVFDEGRIVQASVLIGADGLTSVVRRSLGFEVPGVAAARQGFFEGAGASAAVLMIELGEDGPYYCWAVPKRGGVLVGAADPADARGLRGFPDRALRALADRLPEFAPGAQVAEERGAYARVRSMDEVRLGLPGAFLIGEAAGLVLPSSGEGLGGAMESAVALASVLKETGIAGARPGGPASTAALDRYRAALAPRLGLMASDLAFDESLRTGA